MNAKILKLIGSSILLLSFLTQNYFYDKWKSELEKLDAAGIEQSLMDKSGLLNQILFFTAKIDTNSPAINEADALKTQFLRESVRKHLYGQMIWLLANDYKKPEGISEIRSIMASAEKISSYQDYLNCIQQINAIESIENPQEFINKRMRYTNLKRNARYLYLTSYIFGSLILLLGMFLEISPKRLPRID